MTQKSLSKTKTLSIFIFTILLGFILFIIPNLFFGITKIGGGLTGINLLITTIFQLLSVSLLIYFSLKWIGKDFKFIGWSWINWRSDIPLGLFAGLTWTALQFMWIIPTTGGASRADISQMTDMIDGTFIGLFSYIALGVIGGGITEEIYNRGYFINVLKSTFKNPKTGLWISAIISILFFAAGHLPTHTLAWVDILVPTIMYTALFIYTGRLSASIVAHSIYNMTAILSVYFIYYG
jgi:membrane protease YdiL (CAAX protease family)